MAEINGNTFSDCTSLETVNFGTGLWDIESAAFENCRKLKKVVIKDLFRSMSEAFCNCTSLETVILDGAHFILKYSCFRGCSALRKVYLGKGIEKIDSYTFSGCTALKDMYYAGTQSEWEAVLNNSDHANWLQNITVHYGTDLPE